MTTVRQGSRRPAQQAGELEAKDRASAPAAASYGSDPRLPQLSLQGSKLEHDQSGEQDILGAVETDRY